MAPPHASPTAAATCITGLIVSQSLSLTSGFPLLRTASEPLNTSFSLPICTSFVPMGQLQSCIRSPCILYSSPRLSSTFTQPPSPGVLVLSTISLSFSPSVPLKSFHRGASEPRNRSPHSRQDPEPPIPCLPPSPRPSSPHHGKTIP